MGRAVAAEIERDKRMPQLAQKQHNIAKLQCMEGTQMESPQPERAEKMEYGKTVQVLSQQMAVLRAELPQLKASNNTNAQRRQKSRSLVCKHCQEANLSYCNHCILCGTENHFARGCRRSRGMGNGRRQQQGVQLKSGKRKCPRSIKIVKTRDEQVKRSLIVASATQSHVFSEKSQKERWAYHKPSQVFWRSNNYSN